MTLENTFLITSKLAPEAGKLRDSKIENVT